MKSFVRLFGLSAALSANVFLFRAGAAEGEDLPHIVTREELAQAMRQHGDYDLTKTTNAGRFDAEVFLHLVRAAQERDPQRRPLWIDHRDWFLAYLGVAGLTEATAPLPERLSYQYGQDTWIEYRPERVVRSLRSGGQLQMALNVLTSWPESPSSSDSYSYLDTQSIPLLRVTLHRIVTYRLLDFGDRVALQDIQGITGRPTTGPLGLLFWLIGEGSLMETRFAIAQDGLQVMRGRVKKGLVKVATTATIYPDGRTIKGLPEGRVDLQKIEERLRGTIDVEYQPFQ